MSMEVVYSPVGPTTGIRCSARQFVLQLLVAAQS